jgi:hypothetical protein
MRLNFCGKALNATAFCLTLVAIVGSAEPVRAQYVTIQGFEVAPFIGVRFGGTFEMQPDGFRQTQATLKDAKSYGLSGGVRFDDFSLVDFRWTQASSRLQFGAPLRVLGEALGDVSVNQFHATFTREFPIYEVKGLRSFVTGSLGATHMTTVNDGFTRFSFGFAAGLKQFLGSKFAIRAEASWLPILIAPEVSAFGCGTIVSGGCFVVLNGKLTQQFEMSIGPVVSF